MDHVINAAAQNAGNMLVLLNFRDATAWIKLTGLLSGSGQRKWVHQRKKILSAARLSIASGSGMKSGTGEQYSGIGFKNILYFISIGQMDHKRLYEIWIKNSQSLRLIAEQQQLICEMIFKTMAEKENANPKTGNFLFKSQPRRKSYRQKPKSFEIFADDEYESPSSSDRKALKTIPLCSKRKRVEIGSETSTDSKTLSIGKENRLGSRRTRRRYRRVDKTTTRSVLVYCQCN
ncbi:hypothetical protein TWF481_002582 [Arthrobotrys musiformis]|uniref:Uncharacterized protein n=1 Tax=Arthrobotrys musiformis TaxID=47236 RepID=A0AAV9VQU0_9PEZI